MNKTIFVQAYPQDEIKGMIDGIRLSNDIQANVERLNQDGYKVLNITPITSGTYFEKNPTWKLLDKANYAVGYSYTEGVIILAEI